MARILLLNGTDAIAQALRSDARIETVLLASLSHEVEGAEAPSSYDLVVDCGAPPVRGAARVTDDWVTEARQRGAVALDVLRPPSSHGFNYSRAHKSTQQGYEMPALSTTADPVALFMEPLLDDVQGLLGRSVIDGGSYLGTYRTLATNQYDEPVFMADPKLTRFLLPMPDDEKSLPELVSKIVQRGIFAIRPEVNARSFSSRRSRELLAEIAETTGRFRREIAGLEAQYAEELAFIARFAALATTSGESLKAKVAEALHEVFGLRVEDLDQRFGESKNLDLLIEEDVVVEVKGSERRNARDQDLDDMIRNRGRLEAAGQRVSHMVLIFNGRLAYPLTERTFGPFSDALAQKAAAEKITLVSGASLLSRVLATRRAAYATDALLAELSHPGLLPPLDEKYEDGGT